METIKLIYEPLQAIIMTYIKGPMILTLLKIYPKLRKTFKRYAKMIPINISYEESINDGDLKYLKNSYVIDVAYCNITDKGLKYLKNARIINLDGCCKITDRGLKNMKYVCDINLANNINITNKALKYLNNVSVINLSHCDSITNSGLKYLKNVHTINLSDCSGITKIGLKYLKNIHEFHLDEYEGEITRKDMPAHMKNIKIVSFISILMTDNILTYLQKAICVCVCSTVVV